MRFSIVHPTARVDAHFGDHMWLFAEASAFAGCNAPADVEYIVVVHVSRARRFWELARRSLRYSLPLPQLWGSFRVVVNYGRDCLVDQCNAGILAAQGEIVIGNEDDQRWPSHWDALTSEAVGTVEMAAVRFGNDNGRTDTFFPTATTRRLLRALGPVSPEYVSMYIDDEYAAKVRKYGVVIPAPHIHFQHLHPVHGRAAMDDIYRQENAKDAYKIGREVFERRKAAGFPRVSLPGWGEEAPASVAPPRKERVISICIPGEVHRAEWTLNFFHLVARLMVSGWTVRVHPGFCTNVVQTRMDITRDVIFNAEQEGQAPEYVLWIDDDNRPSADAVDSLIACLDGDASIDGAAGWCWIKTRDQESKKVLWMPSCGNFKPDSYFLLPTPLAGLYADNHSPKTIEWTGFPTFLLRYDAVKKLGPEAFRPIWLGEGYSATGYSGEDVSFCISGQRNGMKFVVVPDAKVPHDKVQELEPHYQVGAGASPATAAAIETAREGLNGPRVDCPPDVKEFMEARV